MLDFFVKNRMVEYPPRLTFPKWRVSEYNIVRNIASIFTYARKSELIGPINNSNVLISLINRFSVDPSMRSVDYYNSISQDSEDIANSLGLTTVRNYGRVFKDVLFKDSNEMICYVNDPFYVKNIENTWMYQDPLKVIYIDSVDLDYNIIPNSKSLKNGLVVYELNVDLMMFMYKKWIEARVNYNRSTSIKVFLSQFVIPNTLKTLVNQVLFNRLLAMLEQPDVQFENKCKTYPFYLINEAYNVDKIYREYIKTITNKRLLLETYINTLPIVRVKSKTDTFLDLLRISIPMWSRKTKWLPWFLRMRHLGLLLELLGEDGLKYNINIYRSFQRELLEYNTNNIQKDLGIPERNILEVNYYRDVIVDKVLSNMKNKK